ncbi:3-deoxy-D-manno-octulosonic acid transferase [Variovorax sp. PCZ-1]|uniref:3-deoxy-D-manno-octulosonic acid transferase n=1 Tax=Variovorax sp. PCZ-1 TaxID=2835533 RepID=UPI001BCC327A|nr:3-deoxy-D-manno-octulosonic acid transferase [Variovorax sp. PCZ-1]MBS7808117.1 3-deoxy-D-manno-octulosonic acid transferase [Variovorax sp. PCZ-1]
MQAFALSVYRLLTWALQPLIHLRLARRAAKEPLYGQWIEERFGEYAQPRSSGWVWIHAVSLGETRAAAILLRELRAQLPGMKLLLTHGTATGREEGLKLLQTGDLQVWQPWDSKEAAQRFIAHFKPRIGIVMETEVWPNLCAAAQSAGVPMVLANARLNARSLRKALRLSALSRPAYASFHRVLAQTQDDADRLLLAGAKDVLVMGNLKFDISLDLSLQSTGQKFKQNSPPLVLMLASSREGEEAQFLEAIRGFAGLQTAQSATELVANKMSVPIQYMIVPRHPQRFSEVQQLCEQAGLRVSRRSQWQDRTEPADIWLGDSLGEMAMYYSLADVALLGGSFEPLGGQNLIEAIAAGCPVIMGPHTYNFQEASDTAEMAGAAVRVPDMASGLLKAAELLADTSQRQTLQLAGAKWLSASQGAATQQANAVAQLLH